MGPATPTSGSSSASLSHQIVYFCTGDTFRELCHFQHVPSTSAVLGDDGDDFIINV